MGPANDIGFVAAFGHALEHTGGYSPQEARRVAGTMLPEILPYDPTRPASFPENGRALTRRRRRCLPFYSHKWQGDAG